MSNPPVSGRRPILWRLCCVVVLGLFAASTGNLSASTPEARQVVAQARAAVESGQVVVERDLSPLFELLRNSDSEDEQRYLVGAIESLGRADGTSPAEVKRYLLDQAIPAFFEIARSADNHFLRGGVLLALRDMGAPRAVLESAAAIAESDADPFVQSRGEVLRSFIRTMPEDSPTDDIRPDDPERERRALEYLRERKLGASPDQLRRSALEGDFEAVEALLAAGVNVNAGEAPESALTAAVFSGCGAAGGDSDPLVRTVELLIDAGADINRRGQNDNTPLLHAAQMCGPRIVGLLLSAGADPNARNGTGMSPLGMAMIMRKLDSAEVLVDGGARLDEGQVEMVAAMATEPRAQDILRRASQP
jgi:hypothetical protein